MSTRCIIRFEDEREGFFVYKHWDGYPTNIVPLIQNFLRWDKGRNNDLSYTVPNFITYEKLDSKIQTSESTELLCEVLEKSVSYDSLHTGIGLVNDFNPDDGENWENWYYVVNLDKHTISVYITASWNKPCTRIATIGFNDEMKDVELKKLESVHEI